MKRREFITLLGGVAAAARVHATLAYIVARARSCADIRQPNVGAKYQQRHWT